MEHTRTLAARVPDNGRTHYPRLVQWTGWEWSPSERLFTRVCLCNITCPRIQYRRTASHGPIYATPEKARGDQG